MEYVRAYEMQNNGQHNGYVLIENSIENIAGYVATTPPHIRVVITDNFDNLILNTIGNYIDRCPDKEFLSRLLPILMAYQFGEREIQEIRYKG